MNKQQVSHTTKKLFTELKKYTKKFAKNTTAEDIHRYRVIYKKLRARLRMIGSLNIYADKPIVSKHLKSTYKICGAIRDLQLQQQRIKQSSKQELKILKSYLHLLKKKLIQFKAALAENVETKKTPATFNRAAEILSDKHFIRQCIHYEQQQWASVCTIIQSGYFTDDKLHSIRKILKDFFYNLDCCNRKQKKKILHLLNIAKDEAYFNKLTVQMGAYQDICSSINFLKKQEPNKIYKQCVELLLQTKKKWVKEKAARKKILIMQLTIDFFTVKNQPSNYRYPKK